MSGANLSKAKLLRADLSEESPFVSTTYLSEADLSEANLGGADLRKAFLSGATLSRAILFSAKLNEAFLEGADLSEAKLSEADLSGEDLSESFESFLREIEAFQSKADLSILDMSAADRSKLDPSIDTLRALAQKDIYGPVFSVLSSAHRSGLLSLSLREANLSRAILRGTNMAHAKVTEEQLEQAKSFEGATMPNGQKYEDWLKSRGENGENSGPS